MAIIIYLFFLNILYLINETNGETCIENVNAACNVGKQNCCLPKLQCCQFGLPCEEGKCCIRNGQESVKDDDCCTKHRKNKGGKMLCWGV